MRLIDADALKKLVKELRNDAPKSSVRRYVCNVILSMLGDENQTPTIEAEPVRHGRWELEVRSFYMDTFSEDIELAVYILAHCSECGEKHPNANQVFSKTLYATEDADDDFRFDEEAEKAKALEEFKQRKYNFAHYCPNCGAKMRGDTDE